MDDCAEWASEGELKFEVGETERHSVNNRKRMFVRIKWARTRQAGWHRRNVFSLLSQQRIWDRSFFILSQPLKN